MTTTFSIIIPTFRRPVQLRLCLEAIDRLDFDPRRFEVIVVDDGSPERVDSIVAEWAGRIDARAFSRAHGGPAAARNAGARAARGRYLAFTDDDCAPAPDWLGALERRLAETAPIAVGGRTINALPRNPYSTASQSLVDYLNGYYNRKPRRARFLLSNNLGVPRDAFHALGGFDSGFRRPGAEDRDFCDRWLHRGFAATYAPEVVVRHTHPLDLATFWRQHFNYGRGACRFHQARSIRLGTAIRIEPPAFYLNLVRHPLAGRRQAPAALLVALMAVSQIANGVGFLWQRSMQGRLSDQT